MNIHQLFFYRHLASVLLVTIITLGLFFLGVTGIIKQPSHVLQPNLLMTQRILIISLFTLHCTLQNIFLSSYLEIETIAYLLAQRLQVLQLSNWKWFVSTSWHVIYVASSVCHRSVSLFPISLVSLLPTLSLTPTILVLVYNKTWSCSSAL